VTADKLNDQNLLPSEDQPWPRILNSLQDSEQGVVQNDGQNDVQNDVQDDGQDDDSSDIITSYTNGKDWHWPGNTVFFFCDLHADVDAFRLSLIASGGVRFKSESVNSVELTSLGRDALFVIGGDCFDKGPSTLQLLNLIYCLKEKGAQLHLLAGNHDVRTYLGLYYADRKEPLLDHLFIRMGSKAVPFLKELLDQFVDQDKIPDSQYENQFKEQLLPADDWAEQFFEAAKSTVHPKKLEKELRRTQEKTIQFLEKMQELDMSFCQVAATIEAFKAKFLNAEGELYWFFDSMRLAHREGSYLYIHAGLDDSIADLIRDKGIEELNLDFHNSFYQDPFELYHGALGNTFRTKYRDSDNTFSEAGAIALHKAGIYAIVHGHRNIRHGQRIIIRANMLNFECDASVDRNTRIKEGLLGPGGAVVIFKDDGTVKGISTDYPFIKSFNPS